MSIPSTGILLIPLGLILAFMPWRFCLAGLMVFSMMSPAAVVNAGNFGLQPGYYLGMLVIGRAAGEIMAGRFTFNGFVISQLRALSWFIAWTFAILFIALCFFQGQIETLPASAGLRTGMTVPFHLVRENFTQLIYLILNACLIYAIAHLGALQQPRRLLSAWDGAVTCGLAFSVAVCLWQFSGLYAGIPFPTDFFYSNAGYFRADSQSMGGLFRINGPFEEPSTLGYTFSGYLLYAWARYRIHSDAPSALMIVACIFCMLVSTSTTAFFGLGLFFAVALFDVATGDGPQTAVKGRASGRTTLIVLVCAGILGGAVVAANNWAAIEIILNNVLFNKSSSSSFQHRSYADFLALQIFAETYGMGLGLGSHRANSLLLTLLSNTGVLGLILFGSFAYARFRRTPALKGCPPAYPDLSLRPFKLGLFALLMVHLVSNPNLSVLTLWLFMGGLLALQAAERREAVVKSQSPAPSSGLGLAPSLSLTPFHTPV